VNQPNAKIVARAIAILGWPPEHWRAVSGGYTPAARFVATSGERRAFVKVATTPITAAMLRQEAVAYQVVEGPFMPRFIGWDDDAAFPMLIIEDLAAARWPPPWDRALVDAVVERIDVMHRTAAALAGFAEVHSESRDGWLTVASDPAPFLSLGVVTADWLERWLPLLIEAEANCALAGLALTHFDLRSDNTCMTDAGPKFVDWSGACLGNPDLDLGFWLPSLAFEGGPNPEEIIGAAPEVAARVSGFFAARAGLPIIPDAPFVRRVQKEQLTTALPWAARALKLEAPVARAR
jgi:thiamine kinase-like enzyme